MTPSEELKDAWTIINILHMERMDAHEVWPRALEWLKRNEAHGPNAAQWHNPERLKMSAQDIAKGWRFLLKDELTTPDDTCLFDDDTGFWVPYSLAGENRHEAFTYRTRTPLPK